MNLYNEIKKIKERGYNEPSAQSKLGQDIILKAIHDSGMAKSTTIKGGVVMRSLSNNSRRATQDLDLDFICYSIGEESIRKFVEQLNCIKGLTIKLTGNITELNHQDYKGKRITISLVDTEETTISLKMDIGVQRDLSMKQDEYTFVLDFQEDTIKLLVNSPTQIFLEKLKSILRFGSQNTRYKDIFDICYLSDFIKIEQLNSFMPKYIYDDPTLHISSKDDILNRIRRIFHNSQYLNNLQKSEKNWLDITTKDAIDKILKCLQKLD